MFGIFKSKNQAEKESKVAEIGKMIFGCHLRSKVDPPSGDNRTHLNGTS